MPATRKRKKVSDEPRTFRCYFAIGDTTYRVTVLQPDPAAARVALRLTKPDGTSYELSVLRSGPHCTCKDFEYASGESRHGCKHVRCLRSLGKLLAPFRGLRKPQK